MSSIVSTIKSTCHTLIYWKYKNLKSIEIGHIGNVIRALIEYEIMNLKPTKLMFISFKEYLDCKDNGDIIRRISGITKHITSAEHE